MEAQRAHGQTKGNRRSERRRRVYRRARIVFNNGYAVFDCIVRNVSGGGAMLEVETLLGIPRAFRIVMSHDRKARSCRVIWRTEKRMGVAFADLQSSA